MHRLIIVIGTLTLLLVEYALAQPFNITRYDSEKGLPSEVVKSIIQDQEGFIWIASDEGVARFDGSQFVPYRNQLSSNFVKGFAKKRDGQLLAITDMGLDKITSLSDTVVISQLVKGGTQPSDKHITYPKAVFEATDGKLWIGENIGITSFHHDSLKKYSFPTHETSTSFVYAFNFAEDSQQRLWASSYNGSIFLYNKQQDQFVRFQLDEKIPNITGLLFVRDKLWVVGYSGFFELTLDLSTQKAAVRRLADLKWITCIFKSNDNSIYLGTRNDGLYSVNLKADQLMVESIPSINEGRVSSITDDQSGGLWVGTHKGIVHLHRSFFRSLTFDGRRTYIQDITGNELGHVFFAVGRQVYQMSEVDNAWETKRVWSFNSSYAMKLATRGNFLLIGLSSGNLQVYHTQTGELRNIKITDNNPQYNTFINALFWDSNGIIWAAKNGLPGVYRIDYSTKNKPNIRFFGPKQGIEDDIIQIKESQSGDLLLLSNSNRRPFYLKAKSASHFTKIPFKPIPCEKETSIKDFAFINDREVALPTSCGLWKVDITNNLVEKIAIESMDGNSLTEAEYNSVIVLPENNFLLGSKMGLILTHQQQGLHYDESSGLPTNTINARCLYLDPKNRLWVGTVEGAAMAGYQTVNPKPTPKPIITAIMRNEQRISFSDFNKFNKLPFDSYLEIHFASLVYPSTNIRYQHRILGKDSIWSISSKVANVFIPQLPNGKYTFQVRAYHSNGYKWSEPASINFKISKAWYLDEWMFLLYAILAIVFIYLIVRLNTWRLVRAKNKLEKVVQERMAESIEQNRLLNEQKEKIERQRDDIQKKNQWLEEAHQTIESKNQELLNVNHELEEKVRKRTSELDKALIELQRYNAELDYFIYRAAHDLRGPIARIMGLANLIRMQNSSDEVTLYVERMDMTLHEMSSMLSRLMETLEIKSNKIVHQPINIQDFLEQTIELFQEAHHQVEVQINIENPEGLFAHADFELLERLFENLLKNAHDFKMEGQKCAQIELTASLNNDGKSVIIDFIDHGKGIPLEAHDHIFDMFYIGTEESKGAGLGLYEVKVIIERLKGHIRLVNSERKHTAFAIILPAYHLE